MDRIQARTYHEIARVSDPDIAPDGDRVAFVRSVPDGPEESDATIHVVPVGGDEMRRFTATDGVDGEPRYSPSGDRLAFVSTRGGADDRRDLWVLPTDGGEARRVTRTAGDVTDIAWAPDGTRLAFTQAVTATERAEGLDLDLDDADGDSGYEREDPDPRVIDRLVYRSAERYFDGERRHVYVADLRAESVDRITDGEFDYDTPAWGDASTLYYVAKRTGDPDDNAIYDVIAHDLAADVTETVTQTAGFEVAIAATADGRIAYTYTPEDRVSLRQTDIHVHDRRSGETTVPTESVDRTVQTDVGIAWGPSDDAVYFAVPDRGRVTLRSAAWDGTGERVVVDTGHVDGMAVGQDAVAYTRSEWDHPGDVFVSTLGGSETNRLTRVNADVLDGRAIPRPEEVRFAAPDGEEIQGWVLTPPDVDPDARYPLVVEVHGGPHAMWSTAGTMWHEFQTLAAAGYVVFWCNPRGSTGYGESFMAAIERDWGPRTMTDVMAGVDRVTDRQLVDEETVFLTGGSFGGYMTAWMLGHTDRFTAAVAQRGVYDLTGFYGATDRAFKLVEWDFGTTPLDDPDLLWEHSPVAYAGDIDAPTLLIHAENDYRVPVHDAELLFRLLKKTGTETRFVRYPREGHELSRSGEPGHVVDRIERIVRWFDGYSPYHDAAPVLGRESNADPSG